MSDRERCVVCNDIVHYRGMKQHLKQYHGWLYIDDVLTPPPDQKHPWTVQDNKWVCLDKNCAGLYGEGKDE